jgi:hypothetical protein
VQGGGPCAGEIVGWRMGEGVCGSLVWGVSEVVIGKGFGRLTC